MGEINTLMELGKKLIDVSFFDLTQDKKTAYEFLEKVILEDCEISEENQQKAALILNINKIQRG